jgi:hypothetical protein
LASVAIPAYATKKAKEKTEELLERKLGYNFIDLITKLVLFYSISFVISKYMEAVIYFQGGLKTVASFFGIKLVQSDQLPKQWVELFVNESEVVSSTPTAPGQFNPPGWDRPYDYGTLEHQEAEPHLFPQKQAKFKFWDIVNAIAIFYIGWEAFKYYERGGKDILTIGIFALLVLVLSVLSFSRFIGKFGFNKFQEDNK